MEIKVKEFNQLTPSEIYEILRCRAEVFALEQGIVYQDMDGLDQHSLHLFIIEDGKIKSYLRVIKPGGKFAHSSIGRVLTIKGERGKGLARHLMLKGIEIALSLSETLEIEAQSYLKDFYIDLGFLPISGEFILEGIPHISMIYSEKMK